MIKNAKSLFLIIACSMAFNACSTVKKRPVTGSVDIVSTMDVKRKNTHRPKNNEVTTLAKLTPLTDLEIRLVNSNVIEGAGTRYLHSELEIINTTFYPTKAFIEGWMLDSNYKRYPLFVEIRAKKGKRVVEIEIPSRSSVNILYLATSDPEFTLGKRSIAVLELKDQGGLKINLTVPSQML